MRITSICNISYDNCSEIDLERAQKNKEAIDHLNKIEDQIEELSYELSDIQHLLNEGKRSRVYAIDSGDVTDIMNRVSGIEASDKNIVVEKLKVLSAQYIDYRKPFHHAPPHLLDNKEFQSFLDRQAYNSKRIIS